MGFSGPNRSLKFQSTVVTLQRLLAFASAGLALYFAYCIAIELFIAWYSGVDPELSMAQRVWSWMSLVVLLLAAVVVLWPAPFRER